jgi:hypothetical protein
MTLTWLGRIALYLAFLGALGGALGQLRALRTKKPAYAVRWAALALFGVAAAVAVM